MAADDPVKDLLSVLESYSGRFKDLNGASNYGDYWRVVPVLERILPGGT